jgi:type II secretory pathway component PulK
VNLSGDKGAVLIITLWILAVLAILSIGIGGRMALELKLTALSRNNAQAFYASKAGVKKAIDVIRKQGGGEKSGSFSLSCSEPENSVFYVIGDERSRLNINSASSELIGRLIAYLDRTGDTSDDTVSNIKNWRDLNGKYDAVEELKLVNGVDSRFINLIKDYITVYPVSGTSKVNVNTAGAAVLYALGFDESDALEIINTRTGEDGVEGTDDDFKFNDVLFLDYLSKLPEESRQLICYSSDCFRVISTGYSADKDVSEKITAVVFGGNILFWDEGRHGSF